MGRVEMDTLCELASAIVERQFEQRNGGNADHSYIAENGDVRYIEEVQDEFNSVLDIVETIINGDGEGQ
jgi:hypothetical protein